MTLFSFLSAINVRCQLLCVFKRLIINSLPDRNLTNGINLKMALLSLEQTIKKRISRLF